MVICNVQVIELVAAVYKPSLKQKNYQEIRKIRISLIRKIRIQILKRTESNTLSVRNGEAYALTFG